MNRLTCTDCHDPISNGLAVLRSVNFAQVAFHRDCWQRRHEARKAAQAARLAARVR